MPDLPKIPVGTTPAEHLKLVELGYEILEIK